MSLVIMPASPVSVPQGWTQDPVWGGVADRQAPRMQNVELRFIGGNLGIQGGATPLLFVPELHTEHIEEGMILGERYRVKSQLGRGGMGCVFLVENLQALGERALKILQPKTGDLGVSVLRFQQEIEVLSGLRHPGLVRLFDAGALGEHLYYTMEVLKGGSLRDHIVEEGYLRVEEALSIIRRVALAIEVLHSRGWIHRDLKSDNIAFNDFGRPVVLDFGLALRAGVSPEERLTKKGKAIGTLHYMAPEQVQRPHTIDHRVDIYAMGVLLYEMLTGMPPHPELRGVELMAKMIVGDLPALSVLRPGLPGALVALCEQAMALKPAQRFASAGAFADATKACLNIL